LLQAYARCHKANPNDVLACNNLQTSLVMCYAAGGLEKNPKGIQQQQQHVSSSSSSIAAAA
jgi:hypothetical protein